MKNQNPKTLIMNFTENLKPELRYDGEESFAEWQREARAKLKELLGLQYMLPCEDDFEIKSVTDCGDYEDTYFSFQSEEGYYVPGHVLMPKNVEGKPPVMLCVQGHSTGMHISIGQPIYEGDEKSLSSGRDVNYAQLAMERGYCAIAIEQRYMGECGGTPEGTGCLCHWSETIVNALPTLLYGRCAIGERVYDITRTIEVIKKYFTGMDTSSMTLMGNSGGGTATFYTACVNEEIQYAMPSCSVCTYKDSIINIFHCGCNYIPGIARYFDMGDLAGLIAPRWLIIIAGKEDVVFPIHGVKKAYATAESLYEAAGAKDHIALIVGDGGHRFYGKQGFEMLEKMREKV